MPTGDTKRFQEIQKAYKIITEYMDNFRFVFDEEEFKKQNPILVSDFDRESITGKATSKNK